MGILAAREGILLLKSVHKTIALAFAISGTVSLHAGTAAADSAKLHSGFKSEGVWHQVAEDRSYWSGVYWGISHSEAGSGIGHRTVWNCPAAAEIADGMFRGRGYCTMTDPDGDQIYAHFDGESPLGETFHGRQMYAGGTGKYAGITGGHDFHCDVVGTNEQFVCTQEIDYTLP